jgi:hypothetical protein
MSKSSVSYPRPVRNDPNKYLTSKTGSRTVVIQKYQHKSLQKVYSKVNSKPKLNHYIEKKYETIQRERSVGPGSPEIDSGDSGIRQLLKNTIDQLERNGNKHTLIEKVKNRIYSERSLSHRGPSRSANRAFNNISNLRDNSPSP